MALGALHVGRSAGWFQMYACLPKSVYPLCMSRVMASRSSASALRSPISSSGMGGRRLISSIAISSKELVLARASWQVCPLVHP